MVRRSLFTILLLICINQVFAQKKNDLVGKWMTKSGEAQIQVYSAGSKFSGRVVWLKKPNDSMGKPEIDHKNPDPDLSKRPIIGMEMLKGFTYSNDGVWDGGTIYDPKTGKTFSCKISMIDINHIFVRGYVGISMLGRTETWSRVR